MTTVNEAQRALLRKLASDAPAEELRAAMASGFSGLELTSDAAAELREDLRCALLVKGELEERRRRERELSELFATAGDLASIRDVDDVLRAIVQRARTLLDGDVAYLMLIDEAGTDTHMRVAVGVMSPAFSILHLPVGAGLGGCVARDLVPYATADYLADERFDHDGFVDSTVAEEGIVAILGVPLMVTGHLLGVLFAADRHERAYSRGQTMLLASLADHAAVALENARLFQGAQDALKQLKAAKVLLESHGHELERSAEAHERLTAIVLQGGSLTDLAEVLSRILAAGIEVLTPVGGVLARGGTADWGTHRLLPRLISDTLEQRSPDSAGSARGVGTAYPVDAPDRDAQAWVAPVIAGGETLAFLFVTADRELTAIDVRTLERAAQVTALLMVWERASADAEQRARGDLIADLARAHPPKAESVRRRCALIGVDADRDYVLVAIRPIGDEQSTRHLEGFASFAAARGGLAGSVDGQGVCLIPGDDLAATARAVHEHLSVDHAGRTSVIADGPVRLVDGIAKSYERARRGLRLLHGLGRSGTAATTDQLGAYGLLFDESARHLQQFIGEQLSAIVDYDASHSTDLLTTLATYLAAGKRHRLAADRLHVHPNTLYQRLRRISELTGVDLTDSDRVLDLHLAIRLRALQHRL